MSKRRPSFTPIVSFLTGSLILLLTLSIPSTVQADDPNPPNNGTCVTCHEDLYFLHDTGNWFCLEESPMACVDCHGGNPATLVREEAHANRTSHPIINDDVTKCQECHPDQCYERVELFDQTAGIGDVLVAAPYIPIHSMEPKEYIPAETPQVKHDFMIVAILSGIALIAYLIVRMRRANKGIQ